VKLSFDIEFGPPCGDTTRDILGWIETSAAGHNAVECVCHSWPQTRNEWKRVRQYPATAAALKFVSIVVRALGGSRRTISGGRKDV